MREEYLRSYREGLHKYKSGNNEKSVKYDSKPAGRKNPELKRQPVLLWRHAMSKASNEGARTLIGMTDSRN